MRRYDNLTEMYISKGFDAECITIEIGARGFIGHRLLPLIRRLRMLPRNIKQLTNEIQKKVEECSYWIWLKQNDKTWVDALPPHPQNHNQAASIIMSSRRRVASVCC